MKRHAIAVLLALPAAGSLPAQGPPPRERAWCPREDICTDDRLEIVFEDGGSVLEIDDFGPGTKVTATVVMDVKSDGVQGWSYGVRHDPRILRFVGAHLFIWSCDFCNRITPSPLFECIDERCSARKEGSGFISAMILSLIEARTLEVRRNTLLAAEYELIADPGPEGTFIEFTDRLAREDGPPAGINITVNGRSGSPRTVIDGWVKRRGDPFHRGDPDGDGRISVTDAAGILLFLFLAGPSPGCLEAADSDDDGHLDTTDPVLILRWLFLGGSAPAPPGPPPGPCGPDPPGSPGRLGCGAYGGC
jgi:hypothetical protein